MMCQILLYNSNEVSLVKDNFVLSFVKQDVKINWSFV